MQIPVRIVLVETSHPGNIGASARAMKTMGLSELALVRPKCFPHAEATARASGAVGVLERARMTETLEEAIADCSHVAGASARLRGLRWPVVDPRTCAETLWRESRSGRAALVLGPERSGLTNEQLALCRQLVHIPTDEDYASLNLAMAVQVLCYELRMARARPAPSAERRDAPLATAAELEGFQRHLERLLGERGFLHEDHPRQLKLKLRRIFQRAELDRNEINILRGALSALEPRRGERRGAGDREALE